MNAKFLSTRKPELIVAICAVYLTTHYANKAYMSRQERRRVARLEAQLAVVNKTLDSLRIIPTYPN